MAPFVELDGTAVQYVRDKPRRPDKTHSFSLFEVLLLIAGIGAMGNSSLGEKT